MSWQVLLSPITGRRHQLRVHCAEIGHRVVGDFTYSDRRDVSPFRMFLHAHRLVVPNSVQEVDISTPDPFTGQAACGYEPEEEVRDATDRRTYELFDAVKSWTVM